jgi:peptide/nickel transport system substrate-binding protein
MNRRQFLARSAAAIGTASLARPAIVRAAAASTLKFVPYADLALLDPLSPAFVTRNHVMMVFDTLFALDANGDAQPQMLAGYTLRKLTLRDGMMFHNGSKVLARDAVASLRRWTVKDAFGQALMDATDELSAPTDRLVQFRLKRAFPLLPQALASLPPRWPS